MDELRESAKALYSPEQDRRYTYDDYAAWDDGKRWELIDGIPYAMSAPTTAHQRISGELHWQTRSFLRGKACEVFAAPFDVRLNADEGDDTVVQPDLLVVCDRAKLDEKGCKGAPDFIIEILSASTVQHDRVVKFNLYRDAGVREYWIVDPDTKLVEAYRLEDGRYQMEDRQYRSTQYAGTDNAPVQVLPGLEISLPDVFAEW